MYRNIGNQGTSTIHLSLIEKLDSRGMLKPNDSPVQRVEDLRPKDMDTLPDPQPKSTPVPMNIEQQVNQIPIQNNTDLNHLLKNSNTNTDTNENQFSDTWFELDYEKSMNTGNLFYSGITKNPIPPPLNTTNPNLQPTNSQPTINVALPNIQQTNATTPENNNHIPNQSYRSYANVTSVAARRSKVKLQYYPPSINENNNGPIVIPIQLCETANEKHANTLFGYFIGANPSFNTVRDHVKTKWASCGITKIKRNGKGFYLFKISDEQGLMNVLQSDNWMIKEVPIFIQRWQPDGKGRCAYARVLIEISANKPWEEYIKVQTWELESKIGVNHSLQLEYSWVPTRCDKCKVYDHSKSTCPLQAVEKPTIPNNTTNNPHHIIEANEEKEGFTSMIWNVRGLCSSSTQNEVASIKGTRIAIGWDPRAWDIFVLHSYDQVVHCKIFSKSSKHTFFVSFLYVENDYRERRKLWEYLRAHQPLVQNEPWLVSGDFNQIQKPSESTRSSSFDTSMGDFERCIEDTNLVDINATRLYYTWNQKPRGIGGLLRKLDRTMGNTNILSLFPRISVMYKPYGIPDHSPAIIELPIGKPKKSYDFKFVNNTTNHTDFLSTVNATWNKRIEGHYMYSLFHKLKQLKSPIRNLAQKMGNPTKKVDALRIEVEKAQEELDRDPDNCYAQEFRLTFCAGSDELSWLTSQTRS
ncbi:hypothetical protein LXL04_015655 [Taraxacum kok-saghyz]